MRRLAAAFVPAAVIAAVSCTGNVAQAADDCFGPPPGFEPAPKAPTKGLRFGMYPGGVAGQLGPAPAEPKPDVPAKQLAALSDLRPKDGPFVVHLYRSYPSSDGDKLDEVERYTEAGYLVEFVVRYRADDDVDGYTRFLRDLVRRVGSNPRFVGMQVTNEVNFTASPDSSDGAYSGARDALIKGVIAAKDEARARGYDQLEIGFNWVYRLDPQSERDFWGYLEEHGGPEFVKSLDWLGLDAYPGTFFPPAATPAGMRTAMIDAMDELRCFSRGAGIPKTVPIHVAENGYPTGAGRSEETQKQGLETMVGTVAEYRANYNVTDHRWFDLRDADTSSPNFQQHYGLMTDDYKPKPAYGSWKRLIGELTVKTAGPGPGAGPGSGPGSGSDPGAGSGSDPGAGSGSDPGGGSRPGSGSGPDRGGAQARPRLRLVVRCYRRGVRAWVRGPGVARVRSVTFSARATRVVDKRRPFRRSVRLRKSDRRRGRRVRVAAVAHLRAPSAGTVRLQRRSPACKRVTSRRAGPA
jgi:hypothetical protein